MEGSMFNIKYFIIGFIKILKFFFFLFYLLSDNLKLNIIYKYYGRI